MASRIFQQAAGDQPAYGVHYTVTQYFDAPAIKVTRTVDGEESVGYYGDWAVALKQTKAWFQDTCILLERKGVAVAKTQAQRIYDSIMGNPTFTRTAAPSPFVARPVVPSPFAAQPVKPVRYWVDGVQHEAGCTCVACDDSKPLDSLLFKV